MLRSVLIASALIIVAASNALAASGSFSGASGHKTSGSVTVTEKAGQLIIRLGKDFSLDRAPDAYVSLGNGSRPLKGGTAGKLRKLRGSGTYSLPATATTKAARKVIIWCRKYAVPLGVAHLP